MAEVFDDSLFWSILCWKRALQWNYRISKRTNRRWMEDKSSWNETPHNTPVGRALVDSTVGGAVMLYGPSDTLEASVPERDWLPWLVGV
jgi:hypothetical protein